MLSRLVQHLGPLAQQQRLRQAAGPAQTELLRRLLRQAAPTVWGQRFGFAEIAEAHDVVGAYQAAIPLCDYETIREDINDMRWGAEGRLWPGKIQAFAVSSGTASAGKIIPVSRATLDANRRFTLTVGLNYAVQAKSWAYLRGQHVSLPGHVGPDAKYPNTVVGEISGHVAAHSPAWIRHGYQAASQHTQALANWETKLREIARETVRKDIRALIMAPTWGLVFSDEVLAAYYARTGRQAETLGEVWPNLQVFISGGVALASYRQALTERIGLPTLDFVETYGASEGFFAFQSTRTDPALELHLHSGVFYEFVPMEDWGKAHPRRYALADVEVGVRYALYVTTCSGLWAYGVGDVVCFTQTFPHKLVVAGRTAEMLDRFGEAVTGEEIRKALRAACATYQASVREFHVAPAASLNPPFHQWLVEFEVEPEDLGAFRKTLDAELAASNRHYHMRRSAHALAEPTILALPRGTFYAWLKKTRRTIGGQTKVPRLLEERDVADGVLRAAGNKG